MTCVMGVQRTMRVLPASRILVLRVCAGYGRKTRRPIRLISRFVAGGAAGLMSLMDELLAHTDGTGPSVIEVWTVLRVTGPWWGHETGGEHRDLSLVKQALAENWTGGEGADLQRVVNHLNLIPTFLNHSEFKEGSEGWRVDELQTARPHRPASPQAFEDAAVLVREATVASGGGHRWR